MVLWHNTCPSEGEEFLAVGFALHYAGRSKDIEHLAKYSHMKGTGFGPELALPLIPSPGGLVESPFLTMAINSVGAGRTQSRQDRVAPSPSLSIQI